MKLQKLLTLEHYIKSFVYIQYQCFDIISQQVVNAFAAFSDIIVSLDMFVNESMSSLREYNGLSVNKSSGWPFVSEIAGEIEGIRL